MANEKEIQPDFSESRKTDGYFTRDIITAHKLISVYLTQTVHDGSTYTGLEHELRNLKEADIVDFYIGSYGGDCHGLIHLISAIRACKAKEINMIVVSPSYSAAATLALVGSSLILEPNTFLMFHNYSSLTGGKGNELLEGMKQKDHWLKGYFRDLHSPFLTPTEINEMEKDQDIYIHANDKTLKARIRRHFK